MRRALALFGLGAIGALTFRVRQLMLAVADLQRIERERPAPAEVSCGYFGTAPGVRAYCAREKESV